MASERLVIRKAAKMAPLRSVDEIREQRDIGFCMVCNKTYEGSPEMLITISNRSTYCKICLRSKLRTADEEEEEENDFIISFLTGCRRSANPNIISRDYEDLKTSSEGLENETDSLESSDEVQVLPRGYVYPNSKFIQNAQEGTSSRNSKMPYSSLRMNYETKSKQKAKKATGNMKVPSASIRMMNAKVESRKRMRPFSIINSEAASNELTLWSTGQRRKQNVCDEDWLPGKGRGELLNEISDDVDDHSESETINKP